MDPREHGRELARRIRAEPSCAVVVGPEHRETLGASLLESLPPRRTHLACYWTTRFGDNATVHKSFVDLGMPKAVVTLIVATPVLDEAVVVRTHIEEFLSTRTAKRIVVAARVARRGVDEQLRALLTPRTASRLEFVSIGRRS